METKTMFCTNLHKISVAELKSAANFNDYFVKIENQVSITICFNF